MKIHNQTTITIIGAGLTGCFLAILLAKRGYPVDVFEKFSKEELPSSATKRSFNLTFYGYAVKALKAAGLWEEVKKETIMLDGSYTRINNATHPVIDVYDKKTMPYYTIGRAELLAVLLNKAQRVKPIRFHFQSEVVSINRLKKTVLLHDHKGRLYKTVSPNVVVGTDGVNSLARSTLQAGQDISHIHEFLPWTYKQLSLSKKMKSALNLPENFMLAWTNKHAVLTAFPYKNGTSTAILILPKHANNTFRTLNTPMKVEKFLTSYFPELLDDKADLTKQILLHPESHLGTMYTSPWYYKDFLVVLGDAAHAFLPFYGQGISAAFGDSLTFARLLDKYGPMWEKIFRDLQESRKQHVDVIATLSKNIFQRYTRESRADYSAIYDKLETVGHRLFPRFILPPLFTLIAPNPNQAYLALQRHNRQRSIARFIGIPLLVRLLTGLYSLYESTQSIKTSSDRR